MGLTLQASMCSSLGRRVSAVGTGDGDGENKLTFSISQQPNPVNQLPPYRQLHETFSAIGACTDTVRSSRASKDTVSCSSAGVAMSMRRT